MSKPPRVIKADQLQGVSPAKFNAVDSLEELQRRAESAKREVEDLQKSAVAKADDVLSRARKEGYAAGYAEGLEQGKADAFARHRQDVARELAERGESLFAALDAAAKRLVEARDLWQAEWERLGLELSVQIAERIVRSATARSSETARRLLAEVLALVGRTPAVTITLHPKDAQSLDLAGDAWAAATQSLGKVQIRIDPELSPGGCKVESEFGSIDAAIESQLERIRVELTGAEESAAM